MLKHRELKLRKQCEQEIQDKNQSVEKQNQTPQRNRSYTNQPILTKAMSVHSKLPTPRMQDHSLDYEVYVCAFQTS